MTEIKPSYIRAFCKTFVMFFLLGSIFFPSVAYFQGGPYSIEQAIGISIISGLFLGFLGTLVFTPRKIKWNEDKISIHCLFPGTGEHMWDDLQAYSSFGKKAGTFLLKFQGKQAYQINPLGFKKSEWNELMRLLTDGFPEKKRTIWLGPIPIK